MNLLKKIYLKNFQKKKYFILKNDEKNYKNFQIYKNKIEKKIYEIQNNISKKRTLNFLHSGHCGDIISSLALIKELSINHECNLFINVNKKLTLPHYKHPAGDVFINYKIYNMLEPLLKFQKYINK